MTGSLPDIVADAVRFGANPGGGASTGGLGHDDRCSDCSTLLPPPARQFGALHLRPGKEDGCPEVALAASTENQSRSRGQSACDRAGDRSAETRENRVRPPLAREAGRRPLAEKQQDGHILAGQTAASPRPAANQAEQGYRRFQGGSGRSGSPCSRLFIPISGNAAAAPMEPERRTPARAARGQARPARAGAGGQRGASFADAEGVWR